MKSITTMILIAALPIIFCIGCSGTPVKFNEIGREFDQSRIDFTKPKTISASKSGFQFLLWVPIGVNDRHEDAYIKLRTQAPNDFITDIKIKESWTWAYVGTIYKTTMEATAYPYKN